MSKPNEKTYEFTVTASKSIWLPIFLAWLVCVIGVLGSLFFSEVMQFPPCVLCWYQRIGLYPLVAVFSVGILHRDPNVSRYAWPILLFGLAMAGYHNLVYYHLIPESITPCSEGVPCTSRQIEWFGVITIPMLSLLNFLFIAGCLLKFRRSIK